MLRSKLKVAAFTLLVNTALLSPVAAQDAAISDDERAKIEQVVRDYLLTNPEIMIEVQTALENKRAAEQQALASAALENSNDAIFNSADDPVLGNPNGDVTVVEFFDYNCGFCRRSLADMEEIIAADDNVRFVLKEFPIFGENSFKVHRVALAFNRIAPAQYQDFHVNLMRQEGQATEQIALDVAEAMGADMSALMNEMQDVGIMTSLNNTVALAGSLGITGTPSYIVGNEVVVGAQGKDVIMEKIDNYRKCGSTRC